MHISRSGIKIGTSSIASPKVSTEDPFQDLQEADPYFCERCRQIDFDHLFQRVVGNVEILTFEHGQEIVQDQNCSFCQALDFIYPSLNKRPHTKLPCSLMLMRKTTHSGYHGLLQKSRPNGSFYISFLPASEGEKEFRLWDKGSRYEGGYIEMVGYLAERRIIEQDCEILSFDYITSFVDVTTLRTWIDDCEAKHSGQCLAKPQRVEGVKFIDCMSRMIVNQPDEETKYVALSYVWGSSTLSQRIVWSDDPIPLPKELPTTIADALQVTERLGIQYLWADRFCIEQEPPDSRKAIKDHQVVNMHNIYGGAYVTIIAAAGDGPQYGLPGISAKLRSPFRVRIGSRTLEATLADPKALIDASKWSTRAWTYQEGLLSRRRLVFTDQQVYFQCSEMAIFEAYEMAQVERSRLVPFFGSPVSPHFLLNIRIGTRISAWDRIMYYSHLDLTNSEDILNGMLGILQRYQDIGDEHIALDPLLYIPQMRHISGLPIEVHISTRRPWITAISRNLPWISLGPGNRRSGFPSWSWTGWTYKEFEVLGYMWHLKPSKSLNPCIRVEMEDGMTFEGSELEDKLSAKHDFSKVKVLHMNAPSLKAQLLSQPFVSASVGRLQDWDKLHNVGKMAVKYEGAQGLYPLNLTDFSILSTHQTMIGIVLDEHLDVAPRKYNDCHRIATVLLIVQKEYYFERVGVSCINRKDLKIAGTTMGDFSVA